MRLRRDARYFVLFGFSTCIWSVALWLATHRPDVSPPVESGITPSDVSNIVNSLLPVSLPERGSAAGPVDERNLLAPSAGLPPRLLGRGRNRSRFYWDVRDSTGQVRRYYARTNAADVVRVLGTISQDLRDASLLANRSADLDSSP